MNGQLPQLTTSEDDLRAVLRRCRTAGQSIGLVPTMGALHAGHLSLVDRCRREHDVTVVSIFVNPKQFGPREDLDNYPRQLEADMRRLTGKADLVFAPTADLIYPQGFSTMIEPPRVSQPLEGEFRPNHFAGVATIVLKLFNLVQPHQAYFGQKDYQQLLVIQHMVRDLNVAIGIQRCPIVRDPDGLALSSRNAYLNPAQRRRALALNRTLQLAEQEIAQGERDGHAVMAQMRQTLLDGGVSDVDYAVVADPDALQVMHAIALPAVLLIAAHVDKTRLIDNRQIDQP